jgi:NADH-quinone oxidoreductase subunit M
MLIVLLILVPLLGGLLTMISSDKLAYSLALLASFATLGISFVTYLQYTQLAAGAELIINQSWIASIGAQFFIGLQPGDGLAMLMLLLTAIVFPLLFVSLQNKHPERRNTFYGLMLLAQAGLMGVFLAKDALLFYVFWEVALIPVYFLSSMYGGPKRIPVTFKFFVYTFVGSLIMLVGILLIYRHASLHSFSWDTFVSIGRAMPASEQSWLFWMMFIAFAIKMPVFPFHTWQPDAYEQSATPVTIVLSAIMVKMGLFAVVRWLLPVIPLGSEQWMNVVMLLSVISIIYASCMALVQTNIKRMIAYSSIAHIGLMCAAIFSHQILGMQGAAIQMFNHGITIAAMWMMVSIIEHRLGTQDLREMGGIAKVAPIFTIGLVVASLANIALPLTNGFIGEFMMFNGLFKSVSAYHIWFTVFAGLGIILAAVYTLNMIQKVAFGQEGNKVISFNDLKTNEIIVMIILVLMILVLGFYPACLMDLIYVKPF